MPHASCFMERLAVAGLGICLASGVVLGGRLGAQAPPADKDQPTFRTGTTLVEVSAIVTRDGVPVTDLQQGDVRVLDNGVEQPLVAFEYVDLTTVEGPAQRRDFVLVIDDWHIDPRLTKPTQDVALRFVDALGDHDRLAIVTTGPHDLVQQLSTDREESRRLILRLRGQGQQGPRLPGEREMRARIALAVLKDVAGVLAQDAVERRAVIVVSEGHPGFGEGPAMNEPADAVMVREEYRRVLEAAAFANIAVYGIDPRGLKAGFPSIGTGGDSTAVAVAGAAAQAAAGAMIGRYYGSLGLLAMNTGGVLTVDTNDLGKHIPQIMRDSRQYYRLAYVQPDPDPGKKHPTTRRITVKIDRPHVEVRARQLYAPRKEDGK
jgi:VWFA-related protein